MNAGESLPTVPVFTHAFNGDGRTHETYFYADPDSALFNGGAAAEIGGGAAAEAGAPQLALLRSFAARNTQSRRLTNGRTCDD